MSRDPQDENKIWIESLLEPLWRQFWKRFSFEPSSCDRWFEEINRRYSEPQRSYHNFHHIVDCLEEFGAVKNLARDPLPLEVAIWLHDVIYDPRRSDNEDQSIQFATRLLNEARDDKLFIQQVAALIHATKHHSMPSDPDAQLMVDIDLAILGQPRERFWKYEKEIRQEYEFIPEDVFRAKRAEILEKFLDRPRIYHGAHFYERYETQARENLRDSIAALQPDQFSSGK